jgi:disulfide bond formation protein DsbB
MSTQSLVPNPIAAARSKARPHPDPYRNNALTMAAVLSLTLPTLLAGIVLTDPEPPAPAWSVEAASLGVDRMEIIEGADVYRTACAVCHGPSGDGVLPLGKPLRNSAFVRALSDDELAGLIADGRPVNDPQNTTGALMPPRGAQGLSDERIASVVTYLRAIQDPSEPAVSVAAWDLRGSDSTGGAAAGVAIELTAHAGYDLFVASCAACHGVGGEGMESLGLPLTTSGFVRAQSDKDLITFVKMGRPIWDENNTTGLDMPPKGGNPAITDDELQTIVDYIRALQKKAMGS